MPKLLKGKKTRNYPDARKKPQSVRLKIGKILETNGKTAYELANAMDAWPAAIYPLLEKDCNATLATLENVAKALSTLLGKKIFVTDLIEEK